MELSLYNLNINRLMWVFTALFLFVFFKKLSQFKGGYIILFTITLTAFFEMCMLYCIVYAEIQVSQLYYNWYYLWALPALFGVYLWINAPTKVQTFIGYFTLVFVLILPIVLVLNSKVDFDTIAYGITFFYTLLLTLIFFIALYHDNQVIFFERHFPFWINLGVFFRVLLSVPLLLLSDFDDAIHGIITILVDLIMLTCFIIGLLCSRTKPTN